MSDSLISYLNPLQWRARPTVGVVRLAGAIGLSWSARGGGLSIDAIGRSLERAFGLKMLKAVALVVNSPGGSAVQSSLIAHRIRQLAAEKSVPVLSFVEDIAASGGYWLATAGDEIFADKSSIVGSIGVISAGFGFVELLQRIGIERRVHTAGPRKLLLDPFRAERPEDVARLQRIQQEIHDNFKAQVRERRGERLRGDEADLFGGDIWTAQSALALGLIDGIGDVRSIVHDRFGKNVNLVPISPQRSWLRRRFGIECSESWAEQLVASTEERALFGRYGL
jgi:signal peptide peptidase SppA